MTKQGGRFEKLKQSVDGLEHAMSFFKQAKKERIYADAIMKNFEVCIEYAWKYFQQAAVEEGFEPASPKEAIKYAGRLGLIDDVEKWIGYLLDRNLSVHDYLGVSEEEYLKTIQSFFADVKKLIEYPSRGEKGRSKERKR